MTVQSIERAFSLLDAVAAGEAGLSELAARVALPKSTAARLLRTLEQVGAVERASSGSYRLGRAVGDLAASGGATADFFVLARPHIRLLARSLAEDAGLSVPEGDAVRYVAQENADNQIQVRDWTGAIIPMHAVPSGLVMLARRSEEDLAAFLAGGLERFTRRTVVDPDALRARLAAIREQGYAWVWEEFAEGINSVAAPVVDRRDRVVAAVHVHGPSYRFPAPGDEDRVARLVVEAAARLGWARG